MAHLFFISRVPWKCVGENEKKNWKIGVIFKYSMYAYETCICSLDLTSLTWQMKNTKHETRVRKCPFARQKIKHVIPTHTEQMIWANISNINHKRATNDAKKTSKKRRRNGIEGWASICMKYYLLRCFVKLLKRISHIQYTRPGKHASPYLVLCLLKHIAPCSISTSTIGMLHDSIRHFIYINNNVVWTYVSVCHTARLRCCCAQQYSTFYTLWVGRRTKYGQHMVDCWALLRQYVPDYCIADSSKKIYVFCCEFACSGGCWFHVHDRARMVRHHSWLFYSRTFVCRCSIHFFFKLLL